MTGRVGSRGLERFTDFSLAIEKVEVYILLSFRVCVMFVERWGVVCFQC